MRKFLFAMVALVASISAYAVPPAATIQKAKTMVENARYQLPVEAGVGMMLTQVSYDSKTYSLVYRYHYTIEVPKPSANTIRERKLAVIHLLKSSPECEDMQFLKDGITFHYNYYDQNGKFMYAIKLTPADIK